MVLVADLERDWLFRQGIVPAQSTIAEQFGNVVYIIKSAFTGEGGALWRDPIANATVAAAAGLWTVVASCGWNGVSFVAGAGDNCPSGSAFVHGTGGAGRSWCVLRSPSGSLPGARFIELLIACDLVAGTQTVRFVWTTNVNPFNVSSPSTTAAPANPTNAVENTNAVDRQLLNTALSDAEVHILRNEDGSVMVLVSNDGNGICEFALICMFLEDADPNDTYPVLFGHQRGTTGDGALTIEGQWATGTLSSGFHIDATPIDMQIAVPKLQSTIAAGASAGATGDGIGGGWLCWPAWVWSNASATRNGLRGRFPDIGVKIPAAVATDTIENVVLTGNPADHAIRRAAAGDFSLLTDGATLFTF